MRGVVKAGVTGKTHDVMVAKAVFWRLGGIRWPCPVLAFMVVGFGILGLRGIGEIASHRFWVYFFTLADWCIV